MQNVRRAAPQCTAFIVPACAARYAQRAPATLPDSEALLVLIYMKHRHMYTIFGVFLPTVLEGKQRKWQYIRGPVVPLGPSIPPA